MGTITFVLFTEKKKIPSMGDISIIPSNGKNLLSLVSKIRSKYIAFLREEDSVSDQYFEKIYQNIQEDFDYCFINYDILYQRKNPPKPLLLEEELQKNIPYAYEYIWSTIFRTRKLEKVLKRKYDSTLNDFIRKTFQKDSAIGEILYYHKPVHPYLTQHKKYLDVKNQVYYKNVIYIGDGCNCVFNGYVSWVRNISRCFGNDYDIVLLYDEIWEPTLNDLKKYFKCIKREYYINYIMDRLLVTYSSYYYPKNLFCIDKSYCFIHGNLRDFKENSTCPFGEDVYHEYIAVSKVAKEKSTEYFPFAEVQAVLNPFQLDKNLVKPHLKLVSAQRYDEVKGLDRIQKLAAVFDELEIPYTWNVFTDYAENTNTKGLIYRERIPNVLPYVADSDYFVLLSRSEALPYSMIEALSVQTKCIGTPLEAFQEIGLVDGENGYIIPFEAFEEDHHDELVKYAKKIYENKDQPIHFIYSSEKYAGYHDIFIK